MMIHIPSRHRSATFHGAAGMVGFTLVELLVSIAIIAVLATLVLMISRKAMDRAKAAANMANLRSLAGQMQGFAADHGYFPPGFDSYFPTTSSFTNIRWPQILPENSGAKPPREEHISPTKATALQPDLTWRPLNHAANATVCYRTGGRRVRHANIQQPHETVLIGDVTTKAGEESTTYKNGNATFTPKGATLTADTPAAGERAATFWTGAGTGQPEYRNSARAHMIFVDGHNVAFREGEPKSKRFSIRY